MKILFVLMIFVMSFVQSSGAEMPGKDTVLTPASEEIGEGAADLVNEICPLGSHCNVTDSQGNRCLPNDKRISIKGEESCFTVAQLCKAYNDKIAKGKKLKKSDEEKFTYYCN